MRKPLWGAALAAIVWAAPAGAVHTEGYPIPYFGVAADYLLTDGARESDAGQGFQLTVGVPLESPVRAVELRFYDTGFKRDIDRKKDYQTGLFVDYVHNFGPYGGTANRLGSGLKPFGTLGVGFIEEDIRADKHLHLALNAGAGVLVPIGFRGLAARLDTRVQGQSNDESVAGEDFLLDYSVNLGIQIPLTLFFDRPVVVAPAPDCPVAVVDPETGRRDCAADSDGDGVGDTVDECPGTPLGTAVDRRGCPRVRESIDDDNDGVPNARDKCPGTQVGLRVDADGCVIAQRTAMAGVTFLPNSSKLTAEGRQTLDGVAGTLKDQENLRVEIAGHTDSVGSEAYNTLLSQQRADAVRTYLIEKGVAAGRMTAVGYGELEPVAPNDTDDGRKANRRVEFRISTD